MPHHNPTTAEEFTTALNALLRTSHENGVDVRGGWECFNHGGPDWDVLVTEVASAESTDGDDTSETGETGESNGS